MRKKRRRTPSELRSLLTEQVAMLRESCVAFDAGREIAAKAIAVRLRVLLHDTPKSHSLLGLLGTAFSWRFLDSAVHCPPGVLPAYHGLVLGRLSTVPGDDPGCFVPVYRNPPVAPRIVPFGQWWPAMVLRDKHSTPFSRKDLVLTAASQEGGAHVDPEVDEAYDGVAHGDGLGIRLHLGDTEIEWANGPVPGSLRQIAFEVLATLERQNLAHG